MDGLNASVLEDNLSDNVEDNVEVLVDLNNTVRYLNLFLLSPVILMGLVGNVLSMLTWSRGCHRNTSTAVLLTTLAVMDTLVLIMPAFEYWYFKVFNGLLRANHVFLCKTLGFFSYFGPSCSSWTVVLVTGERLISIWFPVKVRLLCTRTKMYLSIAIMCFVVAGIYSPFIVGTEVFLASDNNQTTCDWPPEFYEKYFTVWMWVDMCTLFILPFLLIVIGNALILYKLFKSRLIHARQSHHMSHRTRIANSFTVRAIALSIAVLVCLLPVTTLDLYRSIVALKDLYIILYDIAHILLYANSALNFFLYCVIGRGFRMDMKAVLQSMCSAKKVRLDHDLTTNSTHHSLLPGRNSNSNNTVC